MLNYGTRVMLMPARRWASLTSEKRRNLFQLKEQLVIGPTSLGSRVVKTQWQQKQGKQRYIVHLSEIFCLNISL